MISKKTNILKNLFVIIGFVFFIQNNLFSQSYKLPKALILTTGDGDGRGTVSDGVVLALESFNKLGVFTRLENREIILKPTELSRYSILIIPTIKSYHDYPSSLSLTNMSDLEMKNIVNWVKAGGTLVAGNNIGRNFLNKKDRVEKYGKLTENNWELAKCFGIELEEKNLLGYQLYSWNKNSKIKKSNINWHLIPSKIDKNVKVLSWWIYQKDSIPGITHNKFWDGNALFLPTFNLLHPIKDGGSSTPEEIDEFYQYVYKITLGERKNKIRLSPWKNGTTSAFCWTFDDGGTLEQYQTIVNFINKYKNPTLFFVTPDVGNEESKLLKNNYLITLEGHSFSHPDFRKLSYFETKNEFLKNKNYWKKEFNGFRFPYVSNSFWGMYLLEELNFKFETSIAANHFDHIRGSVVPYNISIFKGELYKTLDLLEISQIYNDDWFFYQKSLEKSDYTAEMQKLDAKQFEIYLQKYFNEIVVPNNGVMVYLGHPMYSGISEITMQPLHKMAEFLKTKNVWITTPTRVAERWNKLNKLEVEIIETKNKVRLKLNLPNEKIEELSFRLDKKPKQIICKGKYKIIKREGYHYLVLNVKHKEEVALIY